MRTFRALRVAGKREDTRDSVVLTLEVPEALTDEFRYLPGQHLPVRAEIDGRDERRTYSICASTGERTLRLGVRVQDGGAFSNYIANRVDVGDMLDVMPPSGRFTTPVDSRHEKSYAAFVAGSGITPVLSIAKSILENEPRSSFVMFYGNRERATTMFIEDLWSLKNLYRDRFSLHFIMSREESEIDLYNGRLDADKIRALHAAFLAHAPPDAVFLCGPNPMIDEASRTLLDLGYAAESLHSERFRPGLKGEAPPRPRARAVPDGGTQVAVTIDGQRQTFSMTAADGSILEAARSSGIELPYSCTGGVCSTCRSKLIEGDVEMAVNYALEPWELEKGYILTCQASPKTRVVELDFDQT